MKKRPALFILFALIPVWASSNAQYEQAKELRKHTSGLIDFQTVHPVWSPDSSALYFHKGPDIIRTDTSDGSKQLAIKPGLLKKYFQGLEPHLHRFEIDADGNFTGLVTAGNSIQSLRISEGKIEPLLPKDDPFSLVPRKLNKNTKSGNANGATKLFFINNTDTSVDIEWIDSSKGRTKYASLKTGETTTQNTHAGHVFAAGNLAFTATKQPAVAYLGAEPATPRPAQTSNDWKAEFRDFNLFVKNKKTGRKWQLTTDGSKDWKYTAPLEWSPDGRYLVAMRERAGTKRHIVLIHSAPKDQLQPKTESISYAKPGDELDLQKPHLFDLETGKEIALDDALFSNPWKLNRFHWAPESDRLFFVFNQRGHQVLRMLAIQAETGKIATVIEEISPTFIDYSRKSFLQHLDQTDEAIWMSERSGWNHLYLVDRKTGHIKPITSGNWVVRQVEYVDIEKRQIWFQALGIHPDQDPYNVHYVRINFDGSDQVVLTEGDGTHEVQFSNDRKFYTDTWSRVDQPPVHELRRSSDGKKVTDLGKADASKLLAVHPHLPEPFATKGRDGESEIFGVIYRPTHFDPNQSYPVIEAIYAGPHGQFVPKKFKSFHGPQRMAELGFIVVQIDGMGTNWRSKKFHDVCWKNIKDAGFPDRIAWMKAAAKNYPYMDLTRVGIYGGSAGGQNAMRAVLDHADFYEAAAADCGCHDNRMDKIWWNEAWMGWPIDESYEKSSNTVDAHKLGGKLLLTVGLLDRNVDPSTTLQVVEELIKANKDFEFIAFPSGGHGAGDSEYGQRRRAEFFIRHLQP